jgi:HSP20 family protein
LDPLMRWHLSKEGRAMALMRWNPTRDLLSIRDDMNRLFNEFFGRTEGQEGSWASGAWAPPVDIHETDDALILKAELPGFSKDDVNVELKDNSLTLKGQRQDEKEVKEEQYHRRERTYGSFQRTFMLPATVDSEKVTASYKDGVLELRLPKREAAKPKRITIGG